MKTWIALILSLPLFGITFGGEIASPVFPTNAPPPAVAIFSNLAPPRPIEDYLRTKGWQTLFVQWGQQFDERLFRKFNVIILPTYPQINPKAANNHELELRPDYEEKVRTLLWQFVEQGGGVLTYGGDFPIIREPANVFLKHFGVELLNEQVLDPGHYFKQRKGMEYEYLFTDQIAAEHPAVQGVKMLFYPLRALYGAGHYPLKINKEWQWLVKGTDRAASHPLVAKQHFWYPDESKAGTYSTFPILAASRQFQKGRVVALGWSSIQTFFEYQHYMVDDIYFSRGGDGRSSDGLKFLEQTLAWLAEPSLQANALPSSSPDVESLAKQIGGLKLWLSADKGVQADAVQHVSSWQDQGGQQCTFQQANSNNRPVLVVNGLNGHPVVRFDGTNDMLASMPIALNSEFTVMTVSRMNTVAQGASGTMFSYADAKDQSADVELCIWLNNTHAYGLRGRYPGIDTFGNEDTQFPVSMALTNAVLATMKYSGKQVLDLFLNGSWLAARASTNKFNTMNKCLRIGQHVNCGQYLNGDVAELIVFDKVLKDDDRRVLGRALMIKYGIPPIPDMYVNKPVREKPKMPDPLKWQVSAKDFGVDPAKRWYKGILGARTKLTGGTGTVAEFAAAARSAKLDFIGFMEWMDDISKISKDQWDKYREECKAASGTDLLVLPGQAVQRAPGGVWYFRISDFESPPQRDMLSPDGKWIGNYLYEHFQSGLNTLGPFDLRNQVTPPWVSRAYNSMAVVTIKDGKTDIDLDAFLYQTSLLDDPRPVAIDLITSPSQVAEAAKRFVNLRFCRDLDELRNAFKNPDSYGHTAQVSSGPVITVWQGRNNWPATYGKAIPGMERMMICLRASSEQPLSEAIIYDNTQLYRRFKFDGKTNACDLLINILHDRQHEFTAVVKDSGGRMAIRSQQGGVELLNRRFMCSDRMNSLSQTHELDCDGFQANVTACFMQNKFLNGPFFGYPANPQIIGRVPPYWDGCPGGYVGGGAEQTMWMPPSISPQPSNTYQCLVHRMEYPFGNRDVLCQAIGTECMIPAMKWHDHGFWELQPIPLFNAYTRCYEFKKKPDGSAVALIEGYYTMLKDGKWEPREWHWNKFSHIFYTFSGQPSEGCTWAFVDPASNDFQSGGIPSSATPANYVKQVHPGGYIAYAAAHESAALFPLDEPLLVVQELHDKNWFRAWIGYDRLGKEYKKGDVLPFRFVVYAGSINTPPDTREIEAFRKAFGLHGGAPLYEVKSRKGKVISTRYVLEIESQDGGFAGVITKADLPMRLPIRVRGVNPNWTCGIVERNAKWWLPVGVLDQAGYVALDTSTEHDLWIGNVVMCDQPELRLTLLPDGAGGFSIEAHNPTDQEISATVKLIEDFNLAPPFLAPVTVKSGTSVILDVKKGK